MRFPWMMEVGQQDGQPWMIEQGRELGMASHGRRWAPITARWDRFFLGPNVNTMAHPSGNPHNLSTLQSFNVR